jgi:hypothetical protein
MHSPRQPLGLVAPKQMAGSVYRHPPPAIDAFNALARSELFPNRQKRPLLRQQFLKRLVEPQGHRSLLPRRSTSSTSPSLIVCGPRFTRASDGKPLRRLLIGSKGERLLWVCLFSWHGCLPAFVVCVGSQYVLVGVGKDCRLRVVRRLQTIGCGLSWGRGLVWHPIEIRCHAPEFKAARSLVEVA